MAIQGRDWEDKANAEVNLPTLKGTRIVGDDGAPDKGVLTTDPAQSGIVAHAPGAGGIIQHAETNTRTARQSPAVGSQAKASDGPNVALNAGKPKLGSTHSTPVHGGTDGPGQFNANGHAVSASEIPHPDASNPLDDEPLQKEYVGKTVPTVAGQRSRTTSHEVGPQDCGAAHASAIHEDDSDAILGEAVKSGATEIKR